MGKTADLAMVQKMIIDTLYKEGKSQRVITVNWSRSQCIKSHHARTSSGKGLPSHFWNRNNVRSILPGPRRKITGLLLRFKVIFSDKSTFCISFGNQGLESGGRLERHRIHVAWSPVWSFWSPWWFGVPWRLLVLVHSVLSSTKSMQPSTERFWSTLCFLLLTSFMEMLIYFSCRTLASPHTAKTTSRWFADHDITVLDWPANMSDLKPIWNLWDIFKRKMRNGRSNNTDGLKAQYAPAEPQADHFHATPHWCWSLC